MGIKEVHDDIWLVSFMDYDLGSFAMSWGATYLPKQLLAGRDTVVRCDNLPPAINAHPNIGEAVAVFVRVAL